MLTIRTWMNALGRKRPRECPLWPPDLYAIAGALLRRSGAYLHIFKHSESRTRVDDVRKVANLWRSNIDELRRTDRRALRTARPSEITNAWSDLMAADTMPVSEIRDSVALTDCLIRMALIADDASSGIGIESEFVVDDDGRRPSTFLLLAGIAQFTNDNRSFCLDVPVDVVCVLGKQHTPQRGATFRSLSHHLALFLPNEIEARWIGPFSQPSATREVHEMLNLLLLPWPTRVDSGDFSEVRRVDNLPSGYFRFQPKNSPSPARFARTLKRAIDDAHRHAGKIDGILQPAGALRDTASQKTKAALLDDLRLTQAKHHRWCLDRAQLVSYQLGGQLPVSDSRSCWENIELPPRRQNFVTFNRLTWTVLVCEDLARQDPAAELIRAIGPNLLIALLMDGPQLSGRWPSRYASVLAEDPGTSVLTLTNLGMAERCRPVLPTGRRAEPSRVIALWRDAFTGETEISLDPNDNACVLNLECRLREEFAADGRGDGSQTRYPVFAGFKSFRTEH